MESKHIKPESVRLFALDEADKLMEIAFKPDLTWIFNQLPSHKQVIALSATYPKDLDTIVAKFMSNPQHVRLNPNQSNVLIGVTQFWMSCAFHPLQHIGKLYELLGTICSNHDHVLYYPFGFMVVSI